VNTPAAATNLESLILVILLVFDGLSGLGGMMDLGLSPESGFLFPILGFFYVFFGMVRRRWCV
jgi:hypothetical protein